MDINRLHESSIIAVPQKEQALAWMVEEGPLIEPSGLPMTALRSLVAQQRILRLRNGLYLAPTPDGHLPSLPRTINLVDPEGYISGMGALALHGFEDQDVSRWYSVSATRKADIHYGPFLAHFVVSPKRSRVASRVRLDVRGDLVTVATPARAIIDELDLMPFGLHFTDVARMVRHTVGSGAIDVPQITAEWHLTPSVASARRLGLLIEVVTGVRNADLLRIARSQRGVTSLAGDEVADANWRLTLPYSRAEIARVSR